MGGSMDANTIHGMEGTLAESDTYTFLFEEFER